MNPQHRGLNRSNIPSSAAPLSSNTEYTIKTTQSPSMPSYSTFSPDLKWHNTLPEDFNGRSKSSNSDRPSSVNIKKRASGTFENIDAIIQSHVHHTVTSPNHLSPVPPTHTLSSSPLPSPSKRSRALPNQPAKTPTKSKSSTITNSSGSGMQTPPPSSTATARKRGRPSKKPHSASANSSSTAPSPQGASPTKKLYLGGNHIAQNLTHKTKFVSRHPDSGIAMPASDDAPSTNFHTKDDGDIWDGGLDYMAGFGGNSHGLGHPASFDWSSIRNNASMDNLTPLTDIFGAPLSPRRRQSQSSFTDETSENPTFSFLEFGDPYGLEMPLDVNPNLLFSSTTNSAASSMIGGLGGGCKPFVSVQQPYQHQHLQHLREQELETQRQRQLQENITKERLKRERTVAASGGRDGLRHSSALNHSRSDSFLHAPGRKQDTRAANFNAAAIKRCSSNITRKGEMERAITPEPLPRRIHQPSLRRTTERIPIKVPKTRTEVVLAISPGGRAKTETTVIYESSDTDVAEPVLAGWDSLEESDSSLDDDVPRGLGPDGIDYTLYRQRKAADPFQDARSASQRLNVPSSQNSSRVPPPRTPTRRLPLKMPLSGTGRRSNVFAASTAAAATSTCGRLDSSPRLPTPLNSSPPSGFDRRLRERVRRASHSSLTPSQSMSVLGTPRLGLMQEVSDESEAETVVDGTEIGILDMEEEEEDGDALHALKRVMARRIGDASDAISLEYTPTKSRPGAIKQQILSTGSSIGSRSGTRHGQMLPALLRASPVKKKLFEEQILRSASRQRTTADGGYHPQIKQDLRLASTPGAESSSGTPTKCPTRVMERKIRAGQQLFDGMYMISEYAQNTILKDLRGDSCNNWLHLRCVEHNRKSLPKEFVCMFCIVQAAQAAQTGTLYQSQGRMRATRFAEERSIGGHNSVTPTASRTGATSGR